MICFTFSFINGTIITLYENVDFITTKDDTTAENSIFCDLLNYALELFLGIESR